VTKAKHILIWVLCALMAAVFPLHAVYAETSVSSETVGETTVAPEPETTVAETTVVSEPETTVPETTVVPEPETTVPETTVVPEPETTVPETTVVPEPETTVAETTVVPEPETTVPETTVVPEPETTVPETTVVPEPETTVAETTAPQPAETTAPQKKYTYTLYFAVDDTMRNYQKYVIPLKVTGVVESTYTFTWANTLPAKDGYVFRGWSLIKGGGIETVVVVPHSITGACGYKIIAADKTDVAVTLYPVFTPVTYTVTVNMNGGSAALIPQTSYTVLDELMMPINPTRPGYAFAGWQLAFPQKDALSAMLTLDATVIKLPAGQWGNVVITAQWTPLNYTVIFDLADGSERTQMPYDITKPINLPKPSRIGYGFAGWAVTVVSAGNWPSNDLDAGVLQLPAGWYGDVILTAKWIRIPYTITFNGAGGLAPASIEYTVDRGVVIPTSTRPGYTFLGWKVTTPAGVDHNWPAALEANFLTPTGLWGNVTLEAMWKENTVTFSYVPATPGGTVTPGSELVGADTGAPAARPVPNPGYRFVGWYLDAECRVPVPVQTVDPLTGTLKPAKDAESGLYVGGTYYAKFALILSDLTVTVTGIDAEQPLLFNIVGRPAAAELSPVVLTVALGAGETSVTVTDLPIGTYTVSEQDGWSWRYAGVESLELTVKEKTLLEPAAAVSFTFGPRTDKWLSENADLIYPEKKKDDTEA